MVARTPAELEERLDRMTLRDGFSACWRWLGAHNPDGYGFVWHAGRMRAVHRVSFELSRGPVPAGTELDHLCRVRDCLNPAHLEPVTHRENVVRGAGPSGVSRRCREQTHCKRGHALSGANVHIQKQWNPKYRGTFGRVCIACRRERQRLYRQRRP